MRDYDHLLAAVKASNRRIHHAHKSVYFLEFVKIYLRLENAVAHDCTDIVQTADNDRVCAFAEQFRARDKVHPADSTRLDYPPKIAVEQDVHLVTERISSRPVSAEGRSSENVVVQRKNVCMALELVDEYFRQLSDVRHF